MKWLVMEDAAIEGDDRYSVESVHEVVEKSKPRIIGPFNAELDAELWCGTKRGTGSTINYFVVPMTEPTELGAGT